MLNDSFNITAMHNMQEPSVKRCVNSWKLSAPWGVRCLVREQSCILAYNRMKASSFTRTALDFYETKTATSRLWNAMMTLQIFRNWYKMTHPFTVTIFFILFLGKPFYPFKPKHRATSFRNSSILNANCSCLVRNGGVPQKLQEIPANCRYFPAWGVRSLHCWWCRSDGARSGAHPSPAAWCAPGIEVK